MYPNHSFSSGSYTDMFTANPPLVPHNYYNESVAGQNEAKFITAMGDTVTMQSIDTHSNGCNSNVDFEQNMQCQELSLSLGTLLPSTASVPPFQYQYHDTGFVSLMNACLPEGTTISNDDELKNVECMASISSGGFHDITKRDSFRNADPSNQCLQGSQVFPNILLNSQYLKATQELLDEIVNVRIRKQRAMEKQEKKCDIGLDNSKDTDAKSTSQSVQISSAPNDSNSNPSCELSPAERQNLLDKKTKLLSMLDEVDRRYRHYCNQMQIVVSSLDMVAGGGAAEPYTTLALRTISRHFRCLRDAISSQIQVIQRSLGEQEGIPRLRYVDQQLRKQKALQHLGVMRQAWRPQRGLPEATMATKALSFTLSLNDLFGSKSPKTASKVSVFSVRCSAGNGERPWKNSDARLVLEDGSIWKAKSFGASGTQVGEVVFNTSLTGYQEILTDPSYAGQFVLMTNPHIGNTGINFDDEESAQCFLSGLVIRSLSISTSNWRCEKDLGDYLAERNVMGIYDVDTRAITRRLREDGSLIGVLSTDNSKTDEELLQMSKSWDIVGIDLISGVSCKSPFEWVDRTKDEWEFSSSEGPRDTFHVVAYDFGIKHNILRRLASYGCKITVVPSTWPSSETLKLNPNGVLFSNGPGDPSAVPYAVETVKNIIGKVPVFGICMGHQLLGQALGGTTYKMKFGHHGGNHPVRNLRTGRVEISSQNHNYAVDPTTLPEGVEVTHINLNDSSCAGLAFPARKIVSLQYHPEASPGPHDSDNAFREFIELMKHEKNKTSNENLHQLQSV